jgi:hypothetical protein
MWVWKGAGLRWHNWKLISDSGKSKILALSITAHQPFQMDKYIGTVARKRKVL